MGTTPIFRFEPCLFAMVMDIMTDEIRQDGSWTMMFGDDIVICSESKAQEEEKLYSWRYALERRGTKVNRIHTEYMCLNEEQNQKWHSENATRRGDESG